MPEARPQTTVSIAWDANLEFTGRAGKHEVGIDGSSAAGASPMQYFALALSSCMAIDIVHILTRGRHTLASLNATFTGERADADPRRFTRIGLHFTLATDAEPVVVERAIQLSREKYCSVWGSCRQDIDLAVTYEIQSA